MMTANYSFSSGNTTNSEMTASAAMQEIDEASRLSARQKAQLRLQQKQLKRKKYVCIPVSVLKSHNNNPFIVLI